MGVVYRGPGILKDSSRGCGRLIYICRLGKEGAFIQEAKAAADAGQANTLHHANSSQ